MKFRSVLLYFTDEHYRWHGAFCASPPSASPIGAVNLWYNSRRQCRRCPSTQSLSFIFQPAGREHPTFSPLVPFRPRTPSAPCDNRRTELRQQALHAETVFTGQTRGTKSYGVQHSHEPTGSDCQVASACQCFSQTNPFTCEKRLKNTPLRFSNR